MFKEFNLQVIRLFEDLGVPRPTIDHCLQADKEVLLAIRSALDSGIQFIDDLIGRDVQKPIEKVEVQ